MFGITAWRDWDVIQFQGKFSDLVLNNRGYNNIAVHHPYIDDAVCRKQNTPEVAKYKLLDDASLRMTWWCYAYMITRMSLLKLFLICKGYDLAMLFQKTKSMIFQGNDQVRRKQSLNSHPFGQILKFDYLICYVSFNNCEDIKYKTHGYERLCDTRKTRKER